jgi:hypothetical protein
MLELQNVATASTAFLLCVNNLSIKILLTASAIFHIYLYLNGSNEFLCAKKSVQFETKQEKSNFNVSQIDRRD